jgi:hypothetical protein
MTDTTTTPDTTTTATPAQTPDPRAEALRHLQRGLRDLLARVEQVHETARRDDFELEAVVDRGGESITLEHNGEELSGALTEISDELDGVESDLEDLQSWVDAFATASDTPPKAAITVEQARAIHHHGWLAACRVFGDLRFAVQFGGPVGEITHDAAWADSHACYWKQMGIPPVV